MGNSQERSNNRVSRIIEDDKELKKLKKCKNEDLERKMEEVEKDMKEENNAIDFVTELIEFRRNAYLKKEYFLKMVDDISRSNGGYVSIGIKDNVPVIFEITEEEYNNKKRKYDKMLKKYRAHIIGDLQF